MLFHISLITLFSPVRYIAFEKRSQCYKGSLEYVLEITGLRSSLIGERLTSDHLALTFLRRIFKPSAFSSKKKSVVNFSKELQRMIDVPS